jgi:hypothetical protein
VLDDRPSHPLPHPLTQQSPAKGLGGATALEAPGAR